jgi:hypothetical protein
MLVPFLAAYLAAAPLDAPHAAVLAVISRGEDAAGCDAGQKRKAAAGASIQTLGRVGGDAVILADVQDPCICGAQNCPSYAIRLASGGPRVLLSVFAIAVRNADRAQPLPGLIVDMHDSALVADETTYAFRGGTYVVVASSRVRATDHGHKPNAIPVRFAAGASSAPLHGTASLGWYDAYSFDAAKGQRVTVDAVSSPDKVTLTLFGPGGGITTLTPGARFTLPASGSYQLHVDSNSETDVPYRARLSIH